MRHVGSAQVAFVVMELPPPFIPFFSLRPQSVDVLELGGNMTLRGPLRRSY